MTKADAWNQPCCAYYTYNVPVRITPSDMDAMLTYVLQAVYATPHLACTPANPSLLDYVEESANAFGNSSQAKFFLDRCYGTAVAELGLWSLL